MNVYRLESAYNTDLISSVISTQEEGKDEEYSQFPQSSISQPSQITAPTVSDRKILPSPRDEIDQLEVCTSIIIQNILIFILLWHKDHVKNVFRY
jgi:hypothetical protein